MYSKIRSAENNNHGTDGNSQRYSKICLKIMELSMRDYTIIKVVQDTHHQGDVRYGTAGVYSACMSLISLSWTLFKPPGLWYKFDLDCILSKGDQLFKFIGKFRYLGIENLPQ